ncbi:hypothetical protein IT411_03965 [Candidatus Peregrinibacteria bacterium]|nr:hypothetical protein [Candidatus Peregrinibacteria bacterium]
MQSKSSTFLATISILAILTVLFIAIVDVEDAPARKTFGNSTIENNQNSGKTVEKNGEFLTTDYNNLKGEKAVENGQNDQPGVAEKTEENQPLTDEDIIAETSQLSADDKKYFEENFKGIEESFEKINVNEKPALEFGNSMVKIDGPDGKNKELAKNVTSEMLVAAGYRNFTIQPKPYNGMLFDQFDLSGLGGTTALEKVVTENDQGYEKEVLRIFEFNQIDQDSANQFYEYLKARMKTELGLTINETNQFGLASFYLNFSEPKEYAFLVVKTKQNVYALSYPKAVSNGKTYFELTKKLLSGLN